MLGVALASLSPTAAKNDIRGVVTGRPLSEALETLELDGARCGSSDSMPIVCAYDDTNSMTLFYAPTAPQTVEKVVYAFAFDDLTKTRQRLHDLYGLRKNHIEGPHKLSTGDNLVIDLLADGTGSVTITLGQKAAANPARRRNGRSRR